MDENQESRSRAGAGRAPPGGKAADVARSRKRTRRADTERARLAAIVDSSFDAITGAGLDGTITIWNAAAERLYGYTAEEAMGRHISLIVPDHRRAELEGIFERVWRGEWVPPFETLRRRKDGAELNISLTVSPILDSDGAIIGSGAIAHDITERVRAEAARRLHGRLLDSMAEGVSLSSEDGIIVYTNPAEDRMFGYAPGELPGQPVTVLNAYEPDENARVVAEVIAELKTTGVWRGEWLNRKKDGTIFVTSAHITAVESEGRRHWLCVQEDITARRQAEAEREQLLAALRESEQRLRDIAANFPGLIVRRVTYPDGRIEYPFVSDNAERVLGVPAASGPPVRTLEDLAKYVAPEDLTRWWAAGQKAAAALEPLEIQGRFFAPDGTVRWIRSISRPHRRADGATVWDGVTLDVTAQKEAEEALRESEERLRLALEAGRLGEWDWDLQTDTATQSLRTFQVYGYDAPLPEFKYATFRGHVLPEDREAVDRTIREAIETREPLHFECRIRRVDGELRWIEVSGTPLREEAGAVTRVIGVVSDITERKQAEERRELLIQELDHRVKNMLAVVQAMFKQSRRLSRSVAEFEAAFAGRIGAMAAAHALLTRDRWEGSALADVAAQVLQPYRQQADRIAIRDSDKVMLRPQAATTLAMVLHELATNAAKYGALSAAQGRVELAWAVEAAHPGPVLELRWHETGGPPVAAPARRGFGRQLIERAVEYELGGDAAVSFPPAGMRCRLRIPLTPEVGSRAP